jgi:hypothetical protein
MQCSYSVSTSGLNKGQDICQIGRDILTLARFFPHFSISHSPFHPQNRGKMVEFSDGVFAHDVRINGACFAPKPDVHTSNGLVTAHD